jgi:putative ABC transport system permease protein
VQFALASFLIVGTLTIFAQFDYLTHKKLGYDDRDLLRVNVGGMKRVDIQTLKTELLKSPDVAGVAAKNGGGWYTSAKVNGETQLTFAVETVDEAYVPLIKVPLVAGRWFSAAFPSDSATAVVVNEALVKAAGWKDPIGQVVNFWYFNKQYRVVGVTKDYHYNPLSEAIRPQLFTMNPANGFGNVYVKIRPHSETASLRFVEKTFKNLAPMSPFIYSFKNEENRNAYLSEAKWKQIILFGAILTIFISGIGLFGLSVLSAEKRTKEIGVRKVLGASVRRVVVILSKDFLALVGIALVVSMPLAWLAVNKWLEGYPYRITVGWGLFVMTGVLVILIALATVSIQAVRTAMANPVKSLRAE